MRQIRATLTNKMLDSQKFRYCIQVRDSEAKEWRVIAGYHSFHGAQVAAGYWAKKLGYEIYPVKRRKDYDEQHRRHGNEVAEA